MKLEPNITKIAFVDFAGMTGPQERLCDASYPREESNFNLLSGLGGHLLAGKFKGARIDIAHRVWSVDGFIDFFAQKGENGLIESKGLHRKVCLEWKVFPYEISFSYFRNEDGSLTSNYHTGAPVSAKYFYHPKHGLYTEVEIETDPRRNKRSNISRGTTPQISADLDMSQPENLRKVVEEWVERSGVMEPKREPVVRPVKSHAQKEKLFAAIIKRANWFEPAELAAHEGAFIQKSFIQNSSGSFKILRNIPEKIMQLCHDVGTKYETVLMGTYKGEVWTLKRSKIDTPPDESDQIEYQAYRESGNRRPYILHIPFGPDSMKSWKTYYLFPQNGEPMDVYELTKPWSDAIHPLNVPFDPKQLSKQTQKLFSKLVAIANKKLENRSI